MEKQQITINTCDLQQNEKYDDVFRLIPGYDADLVNKATVMVVGAGALGNEVLKNLALMNVGNILLIDFDDIEYANLCRSVLFREKDIGRLKVEVAAEKVRELNSNVKIMTINGKIPWYVGLGVLRRMDVIIGCLDNRHARYSINKMCHKVNKTWVDGAIERLMGQATVYKPGISCYECRLSENEKEQMKSMGGCAGIAQEDVKIGRIPTTPIASSIIAAIQVQEALKAIHNYDDKLIVGEYFNYEGMSKEVGIYKTEEIDRKCPSHYQYDNIIEAKELKSESTLKEAFDWLEKNQNEQNPVIRLDYALTTQLIDENSGKIVEDIISSPFITPNYLQSKGLPTDRVYYKSESYITKEFSNLGITLKQVGFQPLHIIKVEGEEKDFFIELSGDVEYLKFV